MAGRMRRVVVVAALACAVVALAACSHATGAGRAPAAVTLAYCGNRPQVRPTVIGVICETNDITARELTWTHWGRPTATAIGTAVVDTCAFADCHSGEYSPFPMVVIASRIVRCPQHARAYSRLQYVFVGPSPFAGLPAHMSFKNFMVGASRPGPPPHQTVSLRC